MEEQPVKSKRQPANKASNQARRNFIKTSTLVGAGVAASAVASTQAIADIDPPNSEPAGHKGYELTQHVLDYYKSADI